VERAPRASALTTGDAGSGESHQMSKPSVRKSHAADDEAARVDSSSFVCSVFFLRCQRIEHECAK
jgi:hypothetical protein